MKISAIKQQVKNPVRASIFIDGKYSFSLSFDELVRERLKSGYELDGARLKELQKLSSDGKLKIRTLEWLMSRPHSNREFRDYLRRKKADPEQAAAWEEEFLNKKYLDDGAFSRWFAEIRRKNGKSNRAIMAELYKKGVAKNYIDQALVEDTDEATERQRLQALIIKKRRIPRYALDDTKLIQLLLRQGFRYDDIKAALRPAGD